MTKSTTFFDICNAGSRAIRHLGIVATLALACAAPASALNIVQNGGFEATTFDGWSGTATDPSGFSLVECGAPLVPEGDCDALLSTFGSPSTLSQVVHPAVGRLYSVRFQLLTDGATPTHFTATFGGIPLLDVSDLSPAGMFQQYHFLLFSTSSSMALEFSFQNDPGSFRLDDVQIALPEPAPLALAACGLLALAFARRTSRRR